MSEILSHQSAAEAVGVAPKMEPLVDVSEVPVSVGAEESPDGEGILGVKKEASTERIVGEGTAPQAEETKLDLKLDLTESEFNESLVRNLGAGAASGASEPAEGVGSVEKANLNGAVKIEEPGVEPVKIEEAVPAAEHKATKEDIEGEKTTAAPVQVQVPVSEELPKPTPDASVLPSSKVENEVKAEASAPVDVSTNSEEAKPVAEVSKKEASVPITAEPEATKKEEVKVEEPVVVKTVSISTYHSKKK
jgi:hypothetical protein